MCLAESPCAEGAGILLLHRGRENAARDKARAAFRNAPPRPSQPVHFQPISHLSSSSRLRKVALGRCRLPAAVPRGSSALLTERPGPPGGARGGWEKASVSSAERSQPGRPLPGGRRLRFPGTRGAHRAGDRALRGPLLRTQPECSGPLSITDGASPPLQAARKPPGRAAPCRADPCRAAGNCPQC